MGPALRAVGALAVVACIVYAFLLDPGKVIVVVVLAVLIGVPVGLVGWAVVRIARGRGTE